MTSITKVAAPSRFRVSRWRSAFEFLVVGACTLAFALTAVGITAMLLTHDATGNNDFVEYWASGRLLLQHDNPYSAALIQPLELSAAYAANDPTLIMANPPWALPLVAPLGMLSPGIGQFIWLLISCICLFISVQIIWAICGEPKTQLNFLAYTFAPALTCLLAGQVSIFVLLGLVLFLRLHRNRPFWAGSALWFCLLKPHLFLPFGCILLAWTIVGRRYRILAGVGFTLCVSSALALWFDSLIWEHYSQMMSAERIDRGVIPCLSTALRLSIWPHTLVIQCLPATLGCIWALHYFRAHIGDWDWLKHGALVLLVSVMVAPYTWLMDQAVVIPALLYAVYNTRSRNLIAGLAMASAAIEIATIGGFNLTHSNFYLWTSPVWLGWYLLARQTGGPTSLGALCLDSV